MKMYTELGLIKYLFFLLTILLSGFMRGAIATPLQVKDSVKQLEEVSVLARNKLSSDYVARLPLKNIENPQQYAIVSSELIKEQVITNFDDALKNAAGISKLWSSTGRAGDGAGYYSLRGFAVQPTLVNGLAGLTNGGLDVANIERIEVIKGPSGTLFGSSLISYGGLINTVTKKPYEGFGGEISYTGGSYGLNRITIDFNTNLDKNKQVFLRLNGAYHDENSFQDAGFKKIRYLAPSLSYKVNDKLSFLLMTEFLSAESTNPTMIFFDRSISLLAKNLAELGYDRKRSFTSNALSIKTPVSTIQTQIIYKLSDKWTSQTVLSRGSAKSDGYYSYLYEISQYMPDYPNVPGIFGRYISKQLSTTATTDIQQNFTGDFFIGRMRNRIVMGVDYFNRNYVDNSTGYADAGTITMEGAETGDLSVQAVDAAIAQLGNVAVSNVTQETFSAYVSNVLNFTPALSAMASFRIDHFKNDGIIVTSLDKYKQTSVSPKFGLVYQPVKDRLAIFANYLNGFTNVAPAKEMDNNDDYTGNVIVFKPEHANQWELGLKMDLLQGKLAASLSYYAIDVSNVVRNLGFNQYVQDGKNSSKGVDIDLVANPARGLAVMLGYSYNKSKIEKSDAADYIGRRPESAGPVNIANVWISYKFQNNILKGCSIGFGGNYSDKNIILNRATTGIFTLPSYTILNAVLSYNMQPISISFKLDNICNKDYYKGWSTIEPQMPRRLSANMAFKF